MPTPVAAESLSWKGGTRMNTIKQLLGRLEEQRGQTMAEYAVVLAVITVVIIASLTALGTGIGGALDAVTGILP
jgi:Flp pilus assembly pilin Flp